MAFAIAIHRRASFRGDGPLEGWVWRIVVNEAKRLARRRPSVAAAATTLGRPALWPGRSVGGLPLVRLDRQTLVTGYPRRDHKQPVRHPGLELSYGTLGAHGRLDWLLPAVEVQEGRAPEMAYMFETSSAGPLSFGGDPVQSEGWIDLVLAPTSGSGGGAIWAGQLQRDGLFVTIRASSRQLLLDTARSLTGLPAR
jgi:hypothetical protein